MICRKNNEGGLFWLDNIQQSNQKIMQRKLLPNEVQIDVSGKNKDEVLHEAISIIDNFIPSVEYKYELDDEHNYSSWVHSRIPENGKK